MASRAFTRAPAEEAFLTAIAIAQQQKARGFELHAALSLAKLYQSTGFNYQRRLKSHKRRLWLPTPWIWLTRSVNPRSNKKVPTKYFVGTSRFFRPTERRYLEPR